MPIAVLILIFTFDWRLGVCCLVPLVISFFCMKQMMGGDNAHFMEGYMAALETMNKEAAEYIRGIPVVKVFQQTVYSFKNFHAAIEEYEKYASGYALKCRIPLTGFNVALNGMFILLIPVACMILSGVTGQAAYQEILPDFLFYSLFTPICTTMMSRVMFAGEQLMAAKSAVNRIEGVLKEQPLAEAELPQQPKDASVPLKMCPSATPVRIKRLWTIFRFRFRLERPSRWWALPAAANPPQHSSFPASMTPLRGGFLSAAWMCGRSASRT